jgi:predicted MFS family arabinose efflux permease
MAVEKKIFNNNFIILNIFLFLSYCNIAVFFQFPSYLQYKLGINPEWIGIVISVYSLTGLIIRPLISAVITPLNAKKIIIFSSIAVVLSLILYSFTINITGIIIVRIFHGLAYVVLGTGIMSAIVASVPPDQSGKAFGIIGIITILPFAVLPPLLKPLTSKFSFVSILIYFGLLLLIGTFLILFLKKTEKISAKEKEKAKITKKEFIENLTDINIILLFLISLFLFTSFAATFFYIKGYGIKHNMPNPGWFFTISTFMEIGVRIFCSSYFDRVNKITFLGVSMMLMAVSYFILAMFYSVIMFLFVAVLFGLGIGIAIPLINSLLFDLSKPKLRAFNSNIGVEMFQGGFFIGSLIGGIILSKWNYEAIFLVCGIICLISIGLIFYIYYQTKENYEYNN